MGRQYELLQIGENEKNAGSVSKMKNLVHLMKGCGETLIDKMIIEKVVCALTSHFDHVIVDIQESNHLKTLKLKDLLKIVLNKLIISHFKNIKYINIS